VPAAAGGPLDVLARILSERMRLSLAQPLLIENVAGAAGSIGGVARAPPDGYTLSMGMWGTHVVNPAIYALSYDVVRDFEPILLIGSMPELIVAKKATPAKLSWQLPEPLTSSSKAGPAGPYAKRFLRAFEYLRSRDGLPFAKQPFRSALFVELRNA
jgi:tripartite-type tricarboxylate transporter receptor subunit TctC